MVLCGKEIFLKCRGDLGIVKVPKMCAPAAIAVFLTLSLVTPTLGHPHMWVDLESRVMLCGGYCKVSFFQSKLQNCVDHTGRAYNGVKEVYIMSSL